MENDKDGEDRDGGGGQRTGCRHRGGNRDDRDESNHGGDSGLRAKVVVVAAAARAVCHTQARAQLATRRQRAAVAAGTAEAAHSRGWSCARNGGGHGGGCGYGGGRDFGDGARLVNDLWCTHTAGGEW